MDCPAPTPQDGTLPRDTAPLAGTPLMEGTHLDLGLREVAGATISPCGQYRYDLWREWSSSESKMAFVMLNPSTADALRNDQTIDACIRFAKRDGYGGIVVRNLFAFRTPKPAVLAKAHKAGVDVVGEENDAWLARLKTDRDVACWVAAWGQGSGIPKPLMEWRIEDVFDILGRLSTLALHADPYRGQSPHPLYLRNETPIRPWPARRPTDREGAPSATGEQVGPERVPCPDCGGVGKVIGTVPGVPESVCTKYTTCDTCWPRNDDGTKKFWDDGTAGTLARGAGQ